MKNFEKTLANAALMTITVFVLVALLAPAALAQQTASNRTAADIFAILPDGSTGPEGHLLRQVSIQNSSSHLLGLAFHPNTGALLVIDFGAGKVLNVNPVTGASTVFITVTGNSGLNALTFDHSGNVYVSDSFQGIIWKTGPNGGAGTVWVSNPLLTTTGIPPFGANGVEFNHAQ